MLPVQEPGWLIIPERQVPFKVLPTPVVDLVSMRRFGNQVETLLVFTE